MNLQMNNLTCNGGREGETLFLSQIWFWGVRVIRGSEKKYFGKVNLVGPGARACHMWLHSVYFNWILASGGNGRAILIV